MIARISAQPASSVPSPDAALVQRLLERVDRLEQELRELRNHPAPAAQPPVPAAAAAPIAAATELQTESYPQLGFHGFADLNYRFNNRPGEKNTFTLGQFDLFLTSQIAENISILNEVVVEAGGENGFGLELERLLFQWKLSDALKLDFGRYHTAVGYYNTAYHHGTWFQTATGRPAFLDFEDGGGIIPAHNVGVSVHGELPVAKLGLNYFVEIGNGRAYQPPGTESNLVLNVRDDNSYKSINLALTARPDWAPGWQAGIGVYHDTLTPVGQPRTDELMLHSHLVYHGGPYEFLSEGYLIRHAPVGGPARSSAAGFMQGAVKFGDFTPYARVSFLNAHRQDEVYSLLGISGRHYAPAIGVRYDVSPFAAFKLQYDRLFDHGEKDADQVVAQVAFTF